MTYRITTPRLTEEQKKRAINTTDCPFCGAKVTQPCRKPKGYGRIDYIHVNRVRKYAAPRVL